MSRPGALFALSRAAHAADRLGALAPVLLGAALVAAWVAQLVFVPGAGS